MPTNRDDAALSSDSPDVVIIGAGAAGMMAAARCAELDPRRPILVLEKGPEPLAKVRLTGGGRCNLTHACPDIRAFVRNLPRGGSELIGPFHRFGPAETMAWFEAHGVPLMTELDGRVFPKSGNSEDVVQALLGAAGRGRVRIRTRCVVTEIRPLENGFELMLEGGRRIHCRKALVATGGGSFPAGLGHTLEPCVPSLFSFRTSDRELVSLAGVSADPVRVSAAGLLAEGSLLITHQGVSGPAVLRLSSFGAREFAACGYRFELKIHWLPPYSEEQVFQQLVSMGARSRQKKIGNWAPFGLATRLWSLLLARADVPAACEWGGCPHKAFRRLTAQLSGFALPITGRNSNRDEFVTCGGVRLSEVNFRPASAASAKRPLGAMESLCRPGLYLAGEALDVDGLTGGFNLQAAWTTGALAAPSLLT